MRLESASNKCQPVRFVATRYLYDCILASGKWKTLKIAHRVRGQTRLL